MSVTIRSFQSSFVSDLIDEAFPNSEVSLPVVCVGDVIEAEDQETLLRGHGTLLVDGKLLATVCGVVERVNKLVYVRTLNASYKAEQGDVVVGRIVEVAGKSWRVDLSSRQESRLLLSAVHLPGGVQRRRNAEDELNMRNLYREGDVLCAEVQSVHKDGGIALHTRSEKYCKLKHGHLLRVPANLIRRQKQHFHTVEGMNVQVIIGCNGLIWISPFNPTAPEENEKMNDGDDEANKSDIEDEKSDDERKALIVTRAQLEHCARFANSIRVLAKLHLPIYPGSISQVFETAINGDVATKDMLEPDFIETIVRQGTINNEINI
mmetsp:Transcript_30153/g.55104  ORF Transcript_30153/g.55104 Transcript_30153/m.55104 type:complete len:321 (-) Transcript_30153:15-977(-)